MNTKEYKEKIVVRRRSFHKKKITHHVNVKKNTQNKKAQKHRKASKRNVVYVCGL